jgi:hypothetical protein
MKAVQPLYCIEINARDSARCQIALDIAERGGRPMADKTLAYAFRSAAHRDRIAAEIRGCYGTASIIVADSAWEGACR